MMTIDELKELKERLLAKEKGFYDRMFLIELIDADIERKNGCWYCRGIESHEIDYVKTYVDAYCHELEAYETPLHYCPNCGRKLVSE